MEDDAMPDDPVAHAPAVMRAAAVCDLTLPFYPEFAGREDVLERFHKSGVNFVSLTVGGDSFGLATTMHNIADVRAMIRERDDRMVFVRSVAEIRAAKQAGKLAIGFHFQGSNALESNPNAVALYYELGIRHMLLVYNQMNAAASGCHERVDAGLSRYGLRLVAEMNRVGMLVDCTHTGYRATMEIIEASQAPVMFSHSNARAIWDHERNITDEQARACARTGGIVGVTGVGKFMSARGTAEVGDLLPHIRHFADLIGPAHVALGIDNVYFLEQHYRTIARHPDRWPKGYPPPPWYYFAPEQVPALAEALLDAGFSEPEARGILGENFLRIAEQVWR
jgi:membrane dipeptidase